VSDAADLQSVVHHLDRALTELAGHKDELRDLDAAVGDGDLGITISAGADAARAALADHPPVTVADLLKAVGAAFAKANPSTMGALVGAGMLAAAKEVGDAQQWDRDLALRVGRAAADRVAERGKAEPGDKTVLDAVLPSLAALANAEPGEGLAAMEVAARGGVESTTDRAGRKGRAAWVGERGVGHPDPGAMAYLYLLQSLRSTAG